MKKIARYIVCLLSIAAVVSVAANTKPERHQTGTRFYIFDRYVVWYGWKPEPNWHKSLSLTFGFYREDPAYTAMRLMTPHIEKPHVVDIETVEVIRTIK